MQEATGDSGSSQADSWVAAKRYAGLFGALPSSFTTSIRILMRDQVEFDAAMRPVTKYQVARILKVGSFKGMLYYASKDLMGEYIKDKEFVSVGAMMDMFQPFDIAAMIACYVLYRKARKMLPDEDWEWISQQLEPESQLGAQLGIALPELGVAPGLLVTSLYHFGRCTFALQNQKAYTDYRRQLKKEEKEFDLAHEQELWGCTAFQVGAMILTNFRFGVDISNSYTTGVNPERTFASLSNDWDKKMKMARMWVDCLRKGLDQPIEKIPGKYFPMETARIHLDTKIVEINEGAQHWLTRGKSDVSRELTPQLYEPEVQEEQEFEVPEELKDVFSLDAITSMEEEDFDQLIDQIDAENDGKVLGGDMLSASEIDELEDIVQ